MAKYLTLEDGKMVLKVLGSLSSTDHHSAYQEIPLNEEITIDVKKQMNVLGGHFKVSGFLKLKGELRIRE